MPFSSDNYINVSLIGIITIKINICTVACYSSSLVIKEVTSGKKK